MSVDAIGSSAANSAAQRAGASLASNFDNFLQLLTTQLRNQDPLSPMDSNEFTQQLVQFTSVEQSIATNRNLEQLLSVMRTGQGASAVSYIGKSVEAEGSITSLDETEGARWKYELPGDASEVRLAVYDAEGRLAYETTGELGKGVHEFTWDGSTGSGRKMAEGLYRLRVEALDAQGDPMEPVTTVSGTVSGIETVAGTQMLLVGSMKVRMEDVLSVGLAGS